MKISHIAMYVSDLEKSKDFYIKYFGAVPNEKYCNPKTGLETYFLSFDGYVKLEIMQRPDTVSVENPSLRRVSLTLLSALEAVRMLTSLRSS